MFIFVKAIDFNQVPTGYIDQINRLGIMTLSNGLFCIAIY